MTRRRPSNHSVYSLNASQHRRTTQLFSILEVRNYHEGVYPERQISSLQPEGQGNAFSKSSTLVAGSHFFKSLFSPTILVMPSAFQNGGLFFAIFGHIFLVLLISYNIARLIVCADYLSKREKLAVQTYDQVAFVSFDKCSPKTRAYANHVRTLVNIMVIVTNIDALTIFIIFLARNMYEIVRFYFPDIGFQMRHYIFFQMVPIMLSNTIRQLKYLSPYSIIASILLYGACLLAFQFYFVQNNPTVWERRLVGDYSILRFVAMVLFSQSGISISLTLRSSMKKPCRFLKVPGVYCVTLILTTLIYVPFGFFGYLHFGEQVLPSVVLNLPVHENKAIVIKALTILSVFMTIPIVFYVAFNVLWNNFIKSRMQEFNRISFEYFARCFLVVVLYAISNAIPILGPMIVLKGALFHSQLEVIYPPILEYVAYYPEKGNGKAYCRLIKAVVISSFGIFCCIGGTVIGICDIVSGFKEKID